MQYVCVLLPMYVMSQYACCFKKHMRCSSLLCCSHVYVCGSCVQGQLAAQATVPLGLFGVGARQAAPVHSLEVRRGLFFQPISACFSSKPVLA